MFTAKLLKSFSLLTVGIVGLGATSAFAASDTTSGEVIIRQAVTVTQVRPLDFGEIAKPSTGSNTFTLTAAGTTVVSTDGAGDGFHFTGAEQSGQFDISGHEGAGFAWTIEVTNDFADGGLTLSDPTTSLDTGQSGSSTFAAGDTNVYVGGTLTVDDTAAVADHNDAVITLTVTYE